MSTRNGRFNVLIANKLESTICLTNKLYKMNIQTVEFLIPFSELISILFKKIYE